MNPLISRLIPWAGYGVAALLFWLWLGARDAIIEEREGCNQDKLRSVAEAENIAREALQEAHSRRLAQIEALVRAERDARKLAEMARADALAGAESAQNTIRRLMREAENNEAATIENVCLNADIPADALSGLR